jgi:hypothetical protein
MIKLVLAATAFSLAETALLLLGLQERMYEIKDGRRTTIMRFDFVKGDATLKDQKHFGMTERRWLSTYPECQRTVAR